MKSAGFVIAPVLLAVFVDGGFAQPAKAEFPNRPLRYIVAFPAGGASDIAPASSPTR